MRITAKDIESVGRTLEKIEEELARTGEKLTPEGALVKLLSENIAITTKAGGPVYVGIVGKTRIGKVNVSLGDDLQLSVTTPKSGRWRVLSVRGFEASGTIPHTRALAIFAKIFEVGA